jgi:pimeloyl-ACP methyl ester carboxylesterase
MTEPHPPTGAHEPIVGRYLSIDVDGDSYRTYYETAGSGDIPLVCLHTAGADSRQYRHQLTDGDLGEIFTLYAFDMPWHGRTYPPMDREWWLEEYALTTDFYADFIVAFVEALDLDSPVAMGCSMGGEIVLELAAAHADVFRAVVGLETTDHISLDETGYDDTMMDYFTHPEINQEKFRAEWCLGLHGPDAPESNTRETAWLYSQSGDGVYAGDLHFYTRDFDARDRLSEIDTDDCGVYLLTGQYDFSVTPEDTRRVAEAIDGARFEVMDGLGHYPVTEAPTEFNDYLVEVAAAIAETTE